MTSAQLIDRDSLRFENMSSSDLEQVLTIERNVHVNPWARLSFEESMTKNYLCRVIKHGEKNQVIAYLVVCPVVDELHILNIATEAQYQGIGLGHMLMQEIIDLAEAHSLRKIFLEVRVSNKIAQSLYLKWQFSQIAVRKAYYSVPNSKNISQREDALVFVRELVRSRK